ncbi:MAG: hypothetical protein ABL872_11925 [Lacibacter sp.]
MTLQQSSSVHIQALYSADGILPGCSSKHRLLVINLASVPGRQMVNSPTAQSLERCTQFLKMSRITFILFFFCLKNSSNGQDLKLFKEVKTVFLKSKKESTYDKGIFIWSACNLDSSFYKSDTVLLVSKLYDDCNEIVNIAFHSLTECYITRSHTSNKFGTTRSSVATKKDLFDFNINHLDNDVFITWLNKTNRKITFKFKVLSVENLNEYGSEVSKLKLVRFD